MLTISSTFTFDMYTFNINAETLFKILADVVNHDYGTPTSSMAKST